MVMCRPWIKQVAPPRETPLKGAQRRGAQLEGAPAVPTAPVIPSAAPTIAPVIAPISNLTIPSVMKEAPGPKRTGGGPFRKLY